MDMICYMHEGTPYGHLKVNHKVILPPNLARMCGLTIEETEGYLAELHDAGVYDTDESGCICSRRMLRDENLRSIRAEGGKKGGNPSLKGGKVNLKDNLNDNLKVGNEVKQKPTPSSSSSSSIDSKGGGVWQEPTREQVIHAARNVGLTEQQAGIWFDEMKSREPDRLGRWIDSRGNPISSWQYALSAWAGRFKENNRKGKSYANNSTSGESRIRSYSGVNRPEDY